MGKKPKPRLGGKSVPISIGRPEFPCVPGKPFVDRTTQNEKACCDTFNTQTSSTMIRGHKIMGGMT
jgi:hypothetical protein